MVTGQERFPNSRFISSCFSFLVLIYFSQSVQNVQGCSEAGRKGKVLGVTGSLAETECPNWSLAMECGNIKIIQPFRLENVELGDYGDFWRLVGGASQKAGER